MDNYAGMICAGMWFLINIVLVVWAYKDADARGQNAYLVGALILFAGIPGILVWLLIRDNLTRRM